MVIPLSTTVLSDRCICRGVDACIHSVRARERILLGSLTSLVFKLVTCVVFYYIFIK